MMMSFSKEEKMESKPAGMAPVKMLDKPQKFSCYQFSIQSKRKLYSETSPDAEPDYGADEGMIYNFDLSIETDLKSTQVAEGVSLDDVSKSFEELVEDWKKAKYALPAVAFSEKLFNTKDGVGEIRKLGPGGAYNMHEINFSTQYGVIHLEHDGSLTNEEACALIKSFRLIERR